MEEERNEAPRKSKNISKLILFIFSFFLSLLSLEIFLRIIKYPYQSCSEIYDSAELSLGQFDALTGWSYKSSFSYFEPNGTFEYYFNEDGIRTSDPNAKFTTDKPKIIFIGGSVTFGEALNFEDTFPAKIGSLLKDKYQIINLGVQGFGSDQSLLRLEKYIEKYKPLYVVYTFIPDHINRNLNYDRRLHYACLRYAGTKPVFKVENGSLQYLKKPEKYENIDRFKVPLLLNLSYQNYFEKEMLESGEYMTIAQSIVDRMNEVSKKHGAEVYYIFYDTIYDTSFDNFNFILSENIFGGDESDHVLDFINWATDSSTKGTKYFVNKDDNYHPNASLSAEIAKRFVEKFGERLSY